MSKVFLRKKISERIINGHPWIFKNEIGEEEGKIESGSIVDVFSSNGSFIGKGYINHRSQIKIRLLTYHSKEEINDNFILKRIEKAWQRRLRAGYQENCRVVFSESDKLPGLIVDKFGDLLVMQTLTLGMDNLLEGVINAIKQIFNPASIYLKNDAPVRLIEGLPLLKHFVHGSLQNEFILEEHGIKINVDLSEGQKTGYYLDRHPFKKAILPWMHGAKVLDGFCYTGGFGLGAACNGAISVVGFDNDKNAIECASKNAQINNVEQVCTFECANAFDLLRKWKNLNYTFDVVILDPPSFTKKREDKTKGLNGYKEINMRGIQLLNKKGILITSLSSPHISITEFKEMLNEVSLGIGRKLTQLMQINQASDHPVLLEIPSTDYLKMLVFEVE